MTRYWIGVVSKEHVKRGVECGFAQVCHGKKSRLAQMKKGDGLIYYSPKLSFQEEEKYQKFSAVGTVKTGEIYQVQMTEDFFPYRLDINYFPCKDVSIYEIKNHLSFIRDNPSWGFLFRRGLFEITKEDFLFIAKSMGVSFCENEVSFKA